VDLPDQILNARGLVLAASLLLWMEHDGAGEDAASLNKKKVADLVVLKWRRLLFLLLAGRGGGDSEVVWSVAVPLPAGRGGEGVRNSDAPATPGAAFGGKDPSRNSPWPAVEAREEKEVHGLALLEATPPSAQEVL
jgi:hypothetical protein